MARRLMRPLILILNGPNLNLLGSREPEIYGRESLADIEAGCHQRASLCGLRVEFRQSNHEGQLIDWLHDCRGKAAGIIINAGAYSHSSIALMDALKSIAVPIIEVHLSNIHQREAFRHHSYIAAVAKGVICGLGGLGYLMALDAMAKWLGASPNSDKEA
jgi:3-dehydroquinate dehydratase-2